MCVCVCVRMCACVCKYASGKPNKSRSLSWQSNFAESPSSFYVSSDLEKSLLSKILCVCVALYNFMCVPVGFHKSSVEREHEL